MFFFGFVRHDARISFYQQQVFIQLYYFIWPPLWSSGQSSWLQIQRPRFDSRRYQIFWKVVGLERGPFSLMSTIEEVLGRKSSGSGLENREYGRGDPLRWPRSNPLSTKVGTKCYITLSCQTMQRKICMSISLSHRNGDPESSFRYNFLLPSLCSV
jgi:hypothetical protein